MTLHRMSTPSPANGSRRVLRLFKISPGRFVLLLFVIGSILGLLALGLSRPVLRIVPPGGTNWFSSLETQWEVQNDGRFALYDLQPVFQVESVEYRLGASSQVFDHFSRSSNPLLIARLSPGQKNSFKMEKPMLSTAPLAKATLRITVAYNLPFWPWTLQEAQRFTTGWNPAGELHWERIGPVAEGH